MTNRLQWMQASQKSLCNLLRFLSFPADVPEPLNQYFQRCLHPYYAEEHVQATAEASLNR